MVSSDLVSLILDRSAPVVGVVKIRYLDTMSSLKGNGDRQRRRSITVRILDFINFIKDKPKTDEEPATPFDTIRLFTDVNLVQELRRRGYDVTCKKTIEL